MASPHVMIVAGEASGDAHAARMVAALNTLAPHIRVSGIGGDGLRQAGADIFIDFSDLAVMGLVEVIKRYRHIKQRFNQFVARLKQQRPDLLVLVDYPGFNLKLAKYAHNLGIPVLYYISPKIWASRPGRIKTIQRYVDHMAVLFPFEQTLYEQAGVPVTCVGHPLVDAVHSDLTVAQAKQNLAIEAKQQVLGLFPGSRRSEVEALLPLMLDSAAVLRQQFPELTVVLPIAPGLNSRLFDDILAKSAVPVKTVSGNFYDVIRACDAIVAASGTVTLEIALMGVPHILTYRLAPLSYMILKRLVTIPYVGLCNIVTGENCVTELLQDEANVTNISTQLNRFLTDDDARLKADNVRQQVLTALGPSGGAVNAAKTVLAMLEQ